jgi:hypothetical protein
MFFSAPRRREAVDSTNDVGIVRDRTGSAEGIRG